MYHLYILKSKNFPRHYIGITENLEGRLAKHNDAGVQSTKPYRPWQMIYIENFGTKKEAREREIFLKKTAKARTALFEQIDNNGPIV